ncbi:type III secretion system effector protein [Hymenobacter weizhouensis]|uniref:type III secretion system effector protein n=1 Tax=Hymenobacter sp. YIM 151500-1 TaxID=2987689 RepID=UPI0022261DC2|nr:type III secretion system effector protein [Hymenobacter sp. YIM 151500-1]UYZ64404.1 type III secretion system effector protein [Hymenobacter sp. YIM 151500-1]
MLGHSIVLERASGEEGLDLFEEAVKADLQKIYATPTGRALLQSLHASGKQTTISYAFDGLNRAIIPKAHAEQCYYKADGITPEKGLGLTIAYNPAREVIGEEAWAKRPPAIGLAHELIHAEQAAYGRMREGMGTNPGRINRLDPTKPAQAPVLELETVGVPPHDDYHVTENKIRQEWTPTQPLRTQY